MKEDVERQLGNLASAGTPIGRLKAIGILRSSAEETLKAVFGVLEVEHVRVARSAGARWEDVGGALGISRAAAQKRYSHLM